MDSRELHFPGSLLSSEIQGVSATFLCLIVQTEVTLVEVEEPVCGLQSLLSSAGLGLDCVAATGTRG